MGKTKTVVVDAEWLNEALRVLELEYNTPAGRMHGYLDILAHLAPIVPTLPEGATLNVMIPGVEVAVYTAEIWAVINPVGIEAFKIGTSIRAPLPHAVATYLLHAWSSR